MARVILITGAARRLGAALAASLARDGHRIAIQFRTSREDAEKTLSLIRAAGGDAELFPNPMTHLDDGERLVAEVVRRFGSLDTLINNAGSFVRKRFDEMSWDDWQTGLASTVGAAFIATRAALPQLRGSGRGRIVNLGDASSDSDAAVDVALSYYIGKRGLWTMTRSLAAQEARHGVTVNMVSPGVLEGSVCPTPETEMPLGGYGTPEDILRAIRFLLDDASEAITGTNIHAGGGWGI